MLVKDLDGVVHNWNLVGHISKARITHKSSLHLAARDVIVSVFPTLQVLEEVPITLRRSETLYLDFYLPLKKLCIEVHGEQHYKFVPYYHNNILSFLKSQKRDREKEEWCNNNGITYVVFPFDKQITDWKQRIDTV